MDPQIPSATPCTHPHFHIHCLTHHHHNHHVPHFHPPSHFLFFHHHHHHHHQHHNPPTGANRPTEPTSSLQEPPLLPMDWTWNIQ
ncbi:putative forkhead box protein G1 [Iris pallida]|uniref:Forkhead box protein G1 n=1 Tax=Iris pallida TaxID=29817 RepID=A0AAX6H698_IRIPA|nr:putative forkhead box protein G1 [Iris pallida]